MSGTRKEPGSTPSLGELSQLDLERRPPRGAASPPGPPPRRERPSAWWLLLLLPPLLLAVGLLHFREAISERLIPDSELKREIAAAQDALARGELTRADGQGARERFQAVLARDPDHLDARRGLADVREAALLQARAALAARDFTTARERVALARAMAAPAAELDAIEAELALRESADAGLADLLQRARDAQARGYVEPLPDGALALYQEALRLQPDNAIALDGRRAILAGLLQQAETAMAAGDFDAAVALVARVVESDPSHLGLPEVQARLGEARAAIERAREQALQAATADLRAGRLEAAAEGFEAMLAQDPASAEARQGLEDAAAAMAARAGRQAADFDFEAAEDSLRLASTWSPGSAAGAAAERRLAQARRANEELPQGGRDPALLANVLEQARAAMRRGELIDPPGDSAWDHLRRAAALAPGDAGVRAAMQEYDRRARACFEDELAGNRLGAAQACLDARAVRERGGEGLAADRRRLADRWLAFAEERLGAGEMALARRALDAARGLDPANPNLATFEERLRRAGG
ncbi:hypothetical protein [Arenimonas sp.]|uniref:hypothetical protein n=1 Tax=Arenimonas sp. TaxID=1872635 RepID=UPI0035B1EC46